MLLKMAHEYVMCRAFVKSISVFIELSIKSKMFPLLIFIAYRWFMVEKFLITLTGEHFSLIWMNILGTFCSTHFNHFTSTKATTMNTIPSHMQLALKQIFQVKFGCCFFSRYFFFLSKWPKFGKCDLNKHLKLIEMQLPMNQNVRFKDFHIVFMRLQTVHMLQSFEWRLHCCTQNCQTKTLSLSLCMFTFEQFGTLARTHPFIVCTSI